MTLPFVALPLFLAVWREQKARSLYAVIRARANARRGEASRRATRVRGPIEPLFEPVVAPEHLAVRSYETRRADDSDLGRAGAFGLETRLVGVALGALKCRGRFDAAFFQQRAEGCALADRQALTEFRDKDAAREIGTLVAFKRERHSRGEQARLWKRLRPFERKAHGAAGPLEVAPHVAALGGIDVERRIAPALREEDRPKQERAPDKAHASRIR